MITRLLNLSQKDLFVVGAGEENGFGGMEVYLVDGTRVTGQLVQDPPRSRVPNVHESARRGDGGGVDRMVGAVSLAISNPLRVFHTFFSAVTIDPSGDQS